MEPLKPKDESDDDHVQMTDMDRKRAFKVCCVKFIKTNALVLSMLVGVLFGIILGVGLNSMDPKLTKVQIVYLRFPGDIFLQLMKMLLIPIVVSSLLCSTAEIDIRASGKIGLRALVYYIITLILASLMGIILILAVRPGDRKTGASRSNPTYDIQASPGLAFMDLFRNMVPDNLVEVFFMSKKSKFETRNITWMTPSINTSVGFDGNSSRGVMAETLLTITKESGINMIGIVVCAIVFGCVTSAAGQEAKPFLDFFKALRSVSFRLVAIFIWYSPIGIAFLIAAKLAAMDNPVQTFQDLGLFAVTVIAGLILHGFVVLPLIYLVLLRKNPFRFIPGMFPAMVFAFGSESSSATLPVTIKCLEEKNGVDERVTKLIASVGSTVNMDGTCLYFTMMTIFIAQLNDVPLSAGQIVTICILALSIAMGAAGIPGTAVIYMIMILTSMGLPTEDISTLLTIDWFIARCRTSINILGDGYGAAIIEHLSRHELKKEDANLSLTIHEEEKNVEENDLL